MYSTRLSDFLHMIDVKPGGVERFIASYVLRGHRIAIIETGPTVSVGNLLAGLQEIGIKSEEVDYVAVSHVHLDHAGGAGTLLRHLPNAKLIVHAKGAPHMMKPEKLWDQARRALGSVAEMYGEVQPVPDDRIIVASDGMVMDLGEGIELRVLETLGHASHHLSYYERRSGGMLPGDAAGIYMDKLDVVIPTTPAPFHLEMALASLDKLMRMAPRQLYYTHFGPAGNAFERLKAHKDQLKLWASIVKEGMRTKEDPQIIYERTLERDPSIKAVAHIIKNHMILRRGVNIQNIQGFIEYFRKFPQ